jgi:copper chaperone
METLKFKTNIKCGGCIATITPVLNNDTQIENWAVDLQNADKILTISTEHNAEEISTLLKTAGYDATEIN